MSLFPFMALFLFLCTVMSWPYLLSLCTASPSPSLLETPLVRRFSRRPYVPNAKARLHVAWDAWGSWYAVHGAHMVFTYTYFVSLILCDSYFVYTLWLILCDSYFVTHNLFPALWLILCLQNHVSIFLQSRISSTVIQCPNTPSHSLHLLELILDEPWPTWHWVNTHAWDIVHTRTMENTHTLRIIMAQGSSCTRPH